MAVPILQNNQDMNWETYIAFGDSITIGARTYLGYPEIAGDILQKKLSKRWNIINHSVSGYKAIDLARYIDANYGSLKAQQASITSILIGTNDIKCGTPPREYEIALNQIVIKAKILTQNANVVLLQIPELRKGIMYPYNIKMNASVKIFNQSIIKLAAEHRLRTLSFSASDEHFFDGVHLNNLGILQFGEEMASFVLTDRGC